MVNHVPGQVQHRLHYMRVGAAPAIVATDGGLYFFNPCRWVFDSAMPRSFMITPRRAEARIARHHAQ